MITIVLPARNEPKLNEFLLKLHEVLEAIPEPYEILICMGDRETLNIPLRPLPFQRVVKTYGDSVERSILSGLSQARGERILCLDADGSHPVHLIPEMITILQAYEMAVGSRFSDNGENDSTPFRRLVTWGCGALAHLAGSELTDPMSGFFAVRRDVLNRCRFRPLAWKTCLEIELRARPTILEVPIKFTDRKEGHSKTSWKVGVRIIYQLMGEILK